MTAMTKTEPRAKASGLVRFLGLTCLIGGLLWLVFNLTEAFALSPGAPSWKVCWACCCSWA